MTIDEKHPDGKPWVLLGEKSDDASFLQIDQSQWVLDDVEQGGKATPVSYDVMLYTERGIYRPGETIHVSGLIRDPSGQTPDSFPLRVSVLRPDRRVIKEVTLTPSAEQHGTFQFDLPTRDSAPTGPYRFRVTLPGSDDILGSATALVEAFEPVRIEVKAEPEQKLVKPGESAVVVVDAKYLFGQPAAGLPVTLSGEFRRGTFQSQAVRGYRFDDRSQFNVREVPALQPGLCGSAAATRTAAPGPAHRRLRRHARQHAAPHGQHCTAIHPWSIPASCCTSRQAPSVCRVQGVRLKFGGLPPRGLWRRTGKAGSVPGLGPTGGLSLSRQAPVSVVL